MRAFSKNLKVSSVDVVRRVLEFGDVERIHASTNRLGPFLLYSLSAVHQIRLHVRVCSVRKRQQSPSYSLTYFGNVNCPFSPNNSVQDLTMSNHAIEFKFFGHASLLATPTAVAGVRFLPPFVCVSVCFSARFVKKRCS